MTTYVHGENIWDWFIDNGLNIIVCSTNSVVKANGELVMGAGFAKQVKDRFPDVPKILGKNVKDWNDVGLDYHYLFMTGFPIIAFQVKRHYRQKADLTLIRESAMQLNKTLAQFPGRSFLMNFPGIGKGERTVEQVKPLIDIFPDNVIVFSNEKL